MGKKKTENNKDLEILKSQLARALADYDNLRKRVDKERREIVKLAGVSLFAKLMPAFDMLTRSQEHLEDPGIAQTIKEFRSALKEEGIVNIEIAKGDRFDENFEEVTELEPTKDKGLDQTVSEVILEGWKIEDGPVIRPAKVKVYRKE